MKKFSALLIVFSMFMSMCVLPVTANNTVDIPEDAILIFAENFESGYETDKNLLMEGTNTILKDDKTVLELKNDSNLAESVASVKVVKDTENGFNSNVLAVTNADTSNAFEMYFYLANEEGIDVNDTASPYYGKQLVFEYDVLANGFKENKFLGTYIATAYGFQRVAGSSLICSTGPYVANSDNETKRNWYARPTKGMQIGMTTSPGLSKKKNVKVVMEQMDTFDTIRTYVEGVGLINSTYPFALEEDSNYGKIVKDYVGENFDTETVLDYGEISYLYTKVQANAATTPAVVYIDNIKVYAVNPIEFDSIGNKSSVDPATGVEVKFTEKFNATLDTFKITDNSGTDLADVEITEVTMSADGKTAYVKASGLAQGTEYKIWADDELTSAAGAIFYKDYTGILPENEWIELDSFTTYIKFDLAEPAPADISSLLPNDSRVIQLKTTSAIANIVATYEGGNIISSVIDGKIATFKFTDIAKPVDGTLNVTLTSVDGQIINCSIPVTAYKDTIDYIYNDDLETGYELGSLIKDTSGTSYTNENLVFVTTAASLKDAGTAEIVDDEQQGKVLKMSTLAAGPFRVLYDSGTTHNTSRTASEGNSGKVLVIQTKYKIPNDVQTSQAVNASAINNYSSSTTGARTLWLKYNGNAYIGEGTYATAAGGQTPLNNTEGGATLPKDKWITLTTVVDQSSVATAQNADTFRFYVDGKIHKYAVPGWDKYPELYSEAPYVYDWKPQNYKGMWDMSDIAPYWKGVNENEWGTYKYGDFRGTTTELGANSGKDEHKSDLYIDDFKAWFADKFIVTSVSENKDAFIPNRHTLKVAFNSIVDQNQADLVKLFDDTGAIVDGLKATIANGGYAIDFTLPVENVTSGKTYTLAFSPEFHDVLSYQGLTKNNKNYEIEVKVTDFVAFTGKSDITVVNNFVQGKATKAVVTLSAPTILTDTDAKKGFKVVNSKGNEITEGWSATVSADQRSITLDFTNLETDDYKITSTDALTDKDGYSLEGNKIEISIIAKIGKILLFEENFDSGYTIDQNWLETAPDNGKFGTYVSGESDNNFIGVTGTYPAAATKLSGNALKIYADKGSARVVTARALLEEGINMQEKYPGKVIIYEGDIYCVTTADGSYMFNPSYSATDHNSSPINLKYSSRSAYKIEGVYFSPTQKGYEDAAKAHFGANNDKNASNSHLKFVIDRNNPLSTIKYYIDDVAASQKEYTYLTDHALYGDVRYDYPLSKTFYNYQDSKPGDTLYGIMFRAKSSATVASEFYIDNLKVYIADAFEITSVEGATETFNVAKDSVKFNFSAPVLSIENVKENIKFYDAKGVELTDALTFTLAESGYQVVVNIKESYIRGNSDYKIVISPDLRSEDNVGLSPKYKWYDYTSTSGSAAEYLNSILYEYSWTAKDGLVNAFNPITPEKPGADFNANGYIRDRAAMNLDNTIKTTKSTSLFAEATPAVTNGVNVSTSLTFTNPADEPLDVMYIVAAYGKFREMIGYASDKITVEKGTMDPIAVSFDADSPGIEYVKVFVWSGNTTMIAYQEAESILGVNE